MAGLGARRVERIRDGGHGHTTDHSMLARRTAERGEEERGKGGRKGPVRWHLTSGPHWSVTLARLKDRWAGWRLDGWVVHGSGRRGGLELLGYGPNCDLGFSFFSKPFYTIHLNLNFIQI
jgi:hypothetical protein